MAQTKVLYFKCFKIGFENQSILPSGWNPLDHPCVLLSFNNANRHSIKHNFANKKVRKKINWRKIYPNLKTHNWYVPGFVIIWNI